MAMLDRFPGLLKKKAGDESAAQDGVDQEVAALAAASLAATPEDLAEGRADADAEPAPSVGGEIALPLLGSRLPEKHQRTLSIMLAAALVVLGAATVYILNQAEKTSQQVAASGQALMQSQRLAKSVSQALVGAPDAFAEVRDSAQVLASNTRGLRDGSPQLSLSAIDPSFAPALSDLIPRVEDAERNASAILAQEKVLTQVGTALRSINRQSSDLLEIAETVSSLKLQQDASPSEIAAAGQLVMLTQRIGKSANEFLTLEGVSPEAVFLLGKDLNTFKEIGEGLLSG
ncbi:MAG: methyl-accepting chemotaxis protein, partial [Burkholderiales bacterium]